MRCAAAPGLVAGRSRSTTTRCAGPAVAVVVAALGISGAAASGGTACPGDPAWAITKLFFAERARSIEAAAVVHEGLERARIALSRRQPEIAKQELAAIASALPSVREEEGHTQLVDQQRMLEAVVALTPPLPVDPNLTSTTTPTRPTRPGTSVLAEAAPSATDAGKGTPPVAVQPADPAPARSGRRLPRRHRRHGTTGGTTTDTATGGALRDRQHRRGDRHHRNRGHGHDRHRRGGHRPRSRLPERQRRGRWDRHRRLERRRPQR